MTYEGWSNYQTWNYSLWLNNEEPSYRMLQEMKGAALKTSDPIYALAEALKDLIQEAQPEVKGVYSDLLQHSIDSIDYREIAESELREDLAESEAEAEEEEEEEEDDD